MKSEPRILKSKTFVRQTRIEPYFAPLSMSTPVVVIATIDGEKKESIDKIRLGTLCLTNGRLQMMTDKEKKDVKERIDDDTLVPKTILLRPDQVELIDGFVKRFGKCKLWMSMSSIIRLAVDEGLEDAVGKFSKIPGWEESKEEEK